MSVKEGEQVTLVGRTGAGKSTVFRLLLGLYPPEKGDITISGVNVSAITDHERRACIGCVEQRFSRVPGTVLDQITLSDPTITEEMAQNAAKLAGMDDAIRALPDGYNAICTDGMFSQGECSCCPLARAVAAEPGGAAAGRNHREPRCRNRSARTGSAPPRFRGTHRALHFAPHL